MNTIVQFLIRKALVLAGIKLGQDEVLEVTMKGGQYFLYQPNKQATYGIMPRVDTGEENVSTLKRWIATTDNLQRDFNDVCRDRVGHMQVKIGEIERRERIEKKRAHHR